MAHRTTKWYPTKLGITFGSGSTLTIASGATLAATGWVASTGSLTSMTCAGAATVGSTLVVGTTFSAGAAGFTVAANANTVVGGTLTVTGTTTMSSAATASSTMNVVGNFTVNTTYFTVNATSGAVVAKGNITAGSVGTHPIILDAGGIKTNPASGTCNIYFDGTDLYACTHLSSTGEVSKLTASWA